MKTMFLIVCILGCSSLFARECTYQFASDDVVTGCTDLEWEEVFDTVADKLKKKKYSYLLLDNGVADYIFDLNYRCEHDEISAPVELKIQIKDGAGEMIKSFVARAPRDMKALKRGLAEIEECE